MVGERIMERKELILCGFLLFFIFGGIAYAWWTPHDSINLRGRYEIVNATNATIYGNLTLGTPNNTAVNNTITLIIIPNQSGYIFFQGFQPFYFNYNTTINGTVKINEDAVFDFTYGLVWDAATKMWSPSTGIIRLTASTISVMGDVNMQLNNITNVSWIHTGNLNASNISAATMIGNLNLSKHNITDVDFIFVNNVTGDVVWFHSDIVMEGYSITNASNIEATGNITAEEYFFGPTIEGNIGSGVIWADSIDSDGNVNLTHTPGETTLRYPNITVRLVKTDNTVKYCNITSAWVTPTDDQHTVYYIDNDCAVQSASFATYITTDLSPGGIADIFNVMRHAGEIENHKGVTVKNKEDIKVRKAVLKTAHLRTVSGLGITTETFPNFTIAEGEYQYIREVVNASIQNITAGAALELVYRVGGVWQYVEVKNGINLTDCDDGTDTAPCSTPALYRRYFIFISGYAGDHDHTEVHQLLADEDVTYANIGECLNTVDSPLIFPMPDVYEYAGVVVWAYCGRGNDNSWSGSFIDMRAVQVGSASTDIDTSIFLTRDGTRTLIANWIAGAFNISASFFLGNLGDTMMAGNMTYDSNITHGIGNATDYLGKLFVNVINSVTGYFGNLYAGTLYEAGVSLTSKYLELTDTFGGDVSGTYDNLLVRDTQGLDAGNITTGELPNARVADDLTIAGGNINFGTNTYTGTLGSDNITDFNTEVRSAMNASNFESGNNLTANYFIGNVSHRLNEVECWGNATHPCHWCEYFNGTHKIEESPCTV